MIDTHTEESLSLIQKAISRLIFYGMREMKVIHHDSLCGNFEIEIKISKKKEEA